MFDDVPIEALIDTGAETSVISHRMLRQLGTGSHSTLLPSMTQFRGIGGNQKSLGTALFQYTIGEKQMSTTMHIVDLPHIDMILGMDAFLDHGVMFHMSEGILQFPDEECIALSRRGQTGSTQVHTLRHMKLKAYQGRFISAAPIYGDDWLFQLDHFLVEPLNHVFDRTGLLAGTALTDRHGKMVQVYVMNTTGHSIELGKGMPIALVSGVQKITSHQSPEFVEMHNLCFSQIGDTSTLDGDDNTSISGEMERREQITKNFMLQHEKESVSEERPLQDMQLHYQGVAQNLQAAECPEEPSVVTTTPLQGELLPDHMKPVIQNIDIAGDELTQAISLLNRYRDVFVGPDGKLGRTSACQGHRVDTGDTLPIRQRLRRVPPKRRQVITDFVQELLAQGCIKPSESDWSTPVVIVNKKDGSPRFCLDYRKLNAATKKDAFPLPRIDDALDQLAFRKFFCALDLASGYYQLPMHPKDSHKTAFITHEGLYEWLVLPMGLANSPATFQRCMAQVLKGLIPDSCLAYLDDIIVFGNDFQDTMRNLELVLDRLRQANLKLKPKKCRMFQSEVSYLGHIVSYKGIQTDPKKVESIKNWPTPTDAKGVRSFLGIASYYRKFIPNFTTIASCLTRLTEKDVKFQWAEEEVKSFEELKENLVSAPILSFPMDKGRYIVDTDASNFGIGAVLSQIQGEEEKVIAYASKSLSKSQRRYCTTKRELLAVVHFVGVTFHHYLIGEEFTVRTDHSSLKWLTNFKDADGMLSRWLTILGAYRYTVEHRKGEIHLNADALSRIPRRCPREDCPNCYPDSDMQNVDTLVLLNRGRHLARREVTAKETTVSANDNNAIPLMHIMPVQTDNVAWGLTLDRLRDQQELDDDIRSFKRLLLKYTGERPPKEVIIPESQDVKLFWTSWEDFFIQNDILYRYPKPLHDVNRYVVPLRFRSQILSYLHRNPLAGHFGVYRTINAAVRRFYWPRMRADVRRYVKSCMRCEMSKPGPGIGKWPLTQEIAGAPNERVAFDLVVHYPISRRGNSIILTIGDYFSKFFVAVPLPNRKAEVIARAFLREWVCRLGGCPLTIHTDQGQELTGHVMSHLCEMLRIKPTRTLPYRPQSDGMVERFNGTLKQMLKTAVGTNEDEWDEYLPMLMMAYNSTEQASTGCTPMLLATGNELAMPVDIVFGSNQDDRPWIRPDGSIDYHKYVETLRLQLVDSFAAARKSLRKVALRQQRGYNVHLKKRQFEPGEWVFKWYKPSADKKLGRGWRGPFVVTRVLSDVVYEIQYHPNISARCVHVDHLKKCYSWQARDNWIKNPDYKDPRNPTRTDPLMKQAEMDQILSQEGEDDFDMDEILRTKPPHSNLTTQPPVVVSPARLPTQPPQVVSPAPSPTQPPAVVSPTPGKATGKKAKVGRPRKQAQIQSQPTDGAHAGTGVPQTARNKTVADAGPPGSTRNKPPDPPPVITRYGRVVRPRVM